MSQSHFTALDVQPLGGFSTNAADEQHGGQHGRCHAYRFSRALPFKTATCMVDAGGIPTSPRPGYVHSEEFIPSQHLPRVGER